MSPLRPHAKTPLFPRSVRASAIAVLALAFAPFLLQAVQVLGWFDFPAISAPANPASGARLFYNTATSKMACLTSAGADCMPSGGGGGGGATVSTGAYSSLPSCTTTPYIYSVSNSPLSAYCDGSSNLTFRAFGAAFPGPVLLNSTFTDTLGSANWGNSASGVMYGNMGASSTYQARLKASPVGDFTATLYYSMDAQTPGGATQIGLFGVNAAQTKGVLAAFTAFTGEFKVGAYTCNPINTCSQSGEAVFRTIPNQFLIIRIVKSGIAANVDWSVDGGSQFFRVGGVFISSIDDVSFVGPTMISPAFGGTSGTFYALDIQ